jgi:effector-binding domain-containing protein
MKVLKILGIIILAVILIVVLLGLVAPKDYHVERSINIDASKELVFRHVQYWKHWAAWSPWAERDSTIAVTYEGIDGKKGALYKWVGDPKITGKGEMTNIGVEENAQINFHLSFIEPWESESDGFMKVADADGGTKATWGFYGKNKFPWNIMTLFKSMDKMMEPDFEQGLGNLKDVVEKEAKAIASFQVHEETFSAKSFAAVRKIINMNEITAYYGESFGLIMQELGKAGKSPAGMPCGIYYDWDEGTGKVDLAAAIPVRGLFTAAHVETIKLETEKAYVLDYYGPYHGLATAHLALGRYLVKNGLTPKRPAVEEYVTDPGNESDPEKWLTKIYYFAE